MNRRSLACLLLAIVSLACQRQGPLPSRFGPAIERNEGRRLHGSDFAIAQDTATVAFIDGNSVVQIELDDGSVIRHTIDSESKHLTDVAFSPDGKWMAAMEAGASVPSRVYLFNRNDPDFNLGLYGIGHYPDGAIGGLCFTEDSKWIAGLGDKGSDKKFLLWGVPDCSRQSHLTSETPYLGPLQAGLQRSENRMRLTFRSPKGGWTFAPNEVLNQSLGFLTPAAVGVLGEKDLFILRASDGTPVLKVPFDIQSRYEQEPNPFEEARMLLAPGKQ